jgi:hypothetical protein
MAKCVTTTEDGDGEVGICTVFDPPLKPLDPAAEGRAGGQAGGLTVSPQWHRGRACMANLRRMLADRSARRIRPSRLHHPNAHVHQIGRLLLNEGRNVNAPQTYGGCLLAV